MTTVERYLQLGLQLGRHDEGVVDAYFGPPEIAAAVMAAPLVAPQTLVASAEALLDDLADCWMRDQVSALHTFARALAGESLSYADEVQRCYGVRPVYADEATFAAAHERLDGLLPGPGSLADRYQSWRASILVPMERVEETMVAVIEEARSQTQNLVGIPADDGITVELVSDEPWMAYNFYLGNLRGKVAVNASLPMSGIELLHLAMHETYPGHQAERVLKEHLLVRGQGMIEETLVLSPTPQSLVSEGIGELASQMLLDGDGGEALAAIIHRVGIKLDLTHALEVERTRQQCQWAMVNAALMLHETGASEPDAQGYLERWGLLNSLQATHAVRFVADLSSRAYVPVYPAGLALCRAYVAGEPRRFRRLLTEQIRVRDLIDADNRSE